MEEIINEANDEFVRDLANLGNEIEEKDINQQNNPSLEVFSSRIADIKKKIMEGLYDAGLSSINDMNYIEEKLSDVETQINMNSVECRKDEFKEKFNYIEKDIRTAMNKIYSQKEEEKKELRGIVEEVLGKVVDASFDNSREVDGQMASKFEYLNSITFEQLVSSIKSKLYNIDSDNVYEILNQLNRYLAGQNKALSQDFDSVSKYNTDRLNSLYNKKLGFIYEKTLDDLNLRTEEEIEQQNRRKDLESQFK